MRWTGHTACIRWKKHNKFWLEIWRKNTTWKNHRTI